MLLSLVVLTIQAQRFGCVHSEDKSETRTFLWPITTIAADASRLFPRVRASISCAMPTAPLVKLSNKL